MGKHLSRRLFNVRQCNSVRSYARDVDNNMGIAAVAPTVIQPPGVWREIVEARVGLVDRTGTDAYDWWPRL